MTAIINICFHGIGTPSRDLEVGESPYWVSEFHFESILDEIATWPSVRISFDDGNQSDVLIGLPALVERKLTATFFPLAGRLGAPGSLDARAIRELSAAGMTIGSHGMDHRPWHAMDPATTRRELVDARDQIAAVTGREVEEVALPLGRYDRRVLQSLKRFGYRTVHTSDRRPARARSWIQPRFSVTDGDTALSLRNSVELSCSSVHRARLEAIGFAKRLR